MTVGALSAAIANLNCQCTEQDSCEAHQLLDELRDPPLRYYLIVDCGNCDEEIHSGPNLSLLDHRGLPAIPYDVAAQASFYCDSCGASNYTGDFELHVEGGNEDDGEDEDES